MARLEAHKGIHAYGFNFYGRFTFNTNIIFSHFDELKDRRVCIGAFLVTLEHSASSFVMLNTLYLGVGHWASSMRSGYVNACTGAYGSEIARLTRSGDYAAAADYIYAFLRDSKDDAVYRPEWLEWVKTSKGGKVTNYRHGKLNKLKDHASLAAAKKILT